MAKKEIDWKEILLKGVTTGLATGVKAIAKKTQDAARNAQKKVMQLLFASVFFALGAIFLCIALVFLVNEYLNLSRGWSFLVMGLLLIITGLILKSRFNKTKILQ